MEQSRCFTYLRICRFRQAFPFLPINEYAHYRIIVSIRIFSHLLSGGHFMYSATDLSIINSTYFNIIDLRINHCEIESRNTHHCWKIIPTPDNHFVLYHKHHQADPYHQQTVCMSIQDCLLDIANHDEYQLRGRKPARYHSTIPTFFDEILKAYTS